jgi:hypothetical protein
MRWFIGLALLAAVGVSGTAMAMPSEFSDWSPATRVEAQAGTDPAFNGPGLDGCPFISRNETTLYMASNRPGGLGGLDIWVSRRPDPDAPWGAPENVGAPVNSAANDFCPTIDRNDHSFYFVSNRAGGCGGADIYMTRLRPDGWDAPENPGCNVNSAADEASPFPLPEPGKGKVLYFSSVRPGGFAADAAGAATGDGDLYVSDRQGDSYGTPELVPGANSAFEDGQPNLRRDGRELFFFSNRPGTLGMADIYAATRSTTSDPWSTPVNLGPTVNSPDGADTRPSLSWDGTTLYFGSTRPGGDGSADHYVTTRERVAAQ